MTVGQALGQAAARLAAAGVASPERDAELLLRHVLGWDAARLIASRADALPPPAFEAFAALVAERAARRPLQHLTGGQAFWKHEFRVSPDVLIPRPETELLVEAALDAMCGAAAPIVVDVGTGSGCIAISLALERPRAEVWALDVSPAALAVARLNAAQLGATAIRFAQSDLLSALPAELCGRVDVVVANPPYVDPAEIPGLQPEVRDHEPRLALHAPEGRDALYARLAREAFDALRPGGTLAVEIGQGMEPAVSDTMAAAGLDVRGYLRDLQGIQRVVVGVKPAARR